MRVLLVDDEELALDSLHASVKKVLPNDEIYITDNYKMALEKATNQKIDVAFLDVEMPGMSGLELARQLKVINPETNIVFVTAFPQYALDAHGIFASGYFLKPITEKKVKEAFENLRNPISHDGKHLRVQCFGKFEVFFEGRPIEFKRSKAKELFAYLIDLKGASASTAEIASVMWEEGAEKKKQHKYIWTLMGELKRVLKMYNAENILIHGRDSYAIDCQNVVCDYYQYLDGDANAINLYQGSYMSQYTWGEMTLGALEKRENK